jgi:hypothetical protein
MSQYKLLKEVKHPAGDIKPGTIKHDYDWVSLIGIDYTHLENEEWFEDVTYNVDEVHISADLEDLLQAIRVEVSTEYLVDDGSCKVEWKVTKV